MKIRRFDISLGYEAINQFLRNSIRINGVKLRSGTFFIEYEEVNEKSTNNLVLWHTENEAGTLERVKNVFAKETATNIHWDVDIDRSKHFTYSIVFWEEPKKELSDS